MADITVSTAFLAATTRAMRAVVFTNQYIGYWFQIGTGTDLHYCKTTNGGLTWGAEVSIFAGTVEAFDVWYDQWTPGNTGRDIHIAIVEGGVVDDLIYVRMNTGASTPTFTQVTAVALASTVAGRGQFTSITRARGGNLFIAYDIDAGAEHGLYRSVDNGASWASRTDPIEATLDQAMLFPANAADPQDIWMLYDDDSTTQLTIKTHDDSANTNSESEAITFNNNATDATGQYGFTGSIRHSDGNLIFALANDYDPAGGTADLLVYDWNGTTATALTNIITDKDDFYHPSMFLNQDTPDRIYVGYIGKSDGTQTLGTTAAVYYALSKDRGSTWTVDIAYSTSSTDYRQLWCPLNGEKFQLFWMDISAADAITNNDNSKDFGFCAVNNCMRTKATGINNSAILSSVGIG